jgi:hypothetical protein
MSIDNLLAQQNGDGGWPYVRGRSATEPTVYAVLALASSGESRAAERGARWLRRTQHADGGWGPDQAVAESTWVTALAALAGRELLGSAAQARAIDWLVATEGAETAPAYRLRQWLIGNPAPAGQEFPGWPYFPGTAAWVTPTAVAILALEREERRSPRAQVGRRIAQGRAFLLGRMCQGGGWNHGALRSLGQEARPYPETTGMALAALRSTESAAVTQSIGVARQFLPKCRSADGLHWLLLGLLAHGNRAAGECVPEAPACRTIPDQSMFLLVARAEQGDSPFWT